MISLRTIRQYTLEHLLPRILRRAGTAACLFCSLSMLLSGCGKVPASLRQQLSSPDAHVRCRAAEMLSVNQGPAATHLLIIALADTDRGVRIVAARALGTPEAKEAVGPLITALHDEDKWVRAYAADALGYIGARSACEPLSDLVSQLSLNNAWRKDMWHTWADVESAGFALHKITGQDFGLDGPKWKAWLATQKNQPQGD